MPLAVLSGMANERLSFRLIAIIAGVVALTPVASVMGPASRTKAWFIALATVVAMLEMATGQLYANVATAQAATLARSLCAVAVFACSAVAFIARSEAVFDMMDSAKAKRLLLLLALFGLLMQSAPVVLQPTFTFRDASRDLAKLFGDAAVGSEGAGTLMLETRIPYRDLEWNHTNVDGMVSIRTRVMPRSEFVLEKTYMLKVHPHYRIEGMAAVVESGVMLVNVYRKTREVRRDSPT